MSEGSWNAVRVAVVGIGNELNGDDGAGVQVARALKQALPAREGLLVIDAGPAPENFTGSLRRFAPDLVVLVDAADMGGQPGEVAWIDPGEIDGMSASTHSLPVTVFSRFLTEEIGCRVVFIGIQPLRLDFDLPLSAPVEKAVHRVSAELARRLVG